MRLTASKKTLALVALLAFAAGALAPALHAQYYGRNKVQYQKFNFKVMKTRHFDIYFYLEDEQTVKLAGLMAERWYARYSRMFSYEIKSRQPLILYASSPEFQQTTVIPELMGEGTGGVTESFKRRVVLPYGPSLAETDHVIGHELVHAFQYDIMAQGHSDAARQTDATLRIPLWFIEGMAEYFSIGPVDANTAMWMRDAVRRKDLPTIAKLENYYKYFPYRWGQALWAYITGRWGDEVIGKMMKTIGRTGDYEIVLEGMLGVKGKQLAADWHKSLQDAYNPVGEKTQAATAFGKTLLKGSESSIYNIAPSISPDGTQLVFMSSRDLFSVDMFLADAATGKVVRKLISTALDPHFESIQFIRSAGSWDAKGEKFVLGGIAKGRPELTILDMKKDKVVREIPFPELGEILSPCWSPDDRYIAFSALAGGVSDLFIYDLQNNVLRQMTRDVYGDLEPAWSPDGKKIAFVTERFSTNLEWVDIGHYELALLDVESGQIQKVLAFPNGKNINPQWVPDGSGLYFLSDQNGKTDLYRIDLASGKIAQVTNLYTGISGITDLSPALSVAAATGRIVFSAYDGGYYTIYAIDDKAVQAGQAFLAQFERNPALLPPRAQAEGSLIGLLKNPLFGLPKDTNFAVADVPAEADPRLRHAADAGHRRRPLRHLRRRRHLGLLERHARHPHDHHHGHHRAADHRHLGRRRLPQQQEAAELGRGRLAHRLSVSVLLLSRMASSAASRSSWRTRTSSASSTTTSSAFASYPLSSVQRVEFSGGYRYIGLQRYALHAVLRHGHRLHGLLPEVSPADDPRLRLRVRHGRALLRHRDLRRHEPAHRPELWPGRIAGIRQHQFLDGVRGRPQVHHPGQTVHPGFPGPPPRPVRERLGGSPFLAALPAYWDLVRGYDAYSSSSTLDYDRLFGSKMIVANVELRFPILRLLGLGKGYFGAWPLEAYGFYDAGIAWANTPGNPYWGGTVPEDVKPWFLGGDRKPITSAGVGLRTNLFGMVVLGVNYVYPFQDRPQGWHFQFYISPGF